MPAGDEVKEAFDYNIEKARVLSDLTLIKEIRDILDGTVESWIKEAKSRYDIA